MDKRTKTDEDLYARKPISGGSMQGRAAGSNALPYGIVKRVVFSGISRDEISDIGRAARLQYRLLLLDPVLRAKVDSLGCTITIIYNPETAANRNEKMSLKSIVEFLSRQGVHVSEKRAELSDLEYRREIYDYNYNPSTIRERPPFGYTLDEWRNGMRLKFEESVRAADTKKLAGFRAWQKKFKGEHPELAGKAGHSQS